MNEEARKFLSKATRSLEKAVQLCDRGAPVPAAGRAYYAMLYSAQALLRQRGVRVRKHAAVCEALAERFTRPGRMDARFHSFLRAVLDMREQTEPLEILTTREDVEAMIERAHDFLAASRALLGAD